MSINPLEGYLLSQLAAFFFLFCRMGAAFMVMPGFGEMYVSTRIRLLFALSFALLLTPLLQEKMPTMPSSPLGLGLLVASESLIGFFIGTLARSFLSALHVAGHLIAAQSSLSVASMFDPSSGGQAPVISNMLTVAALALFFALDLHHMVLATMVQSYEIFPVGQFPATSDMHVLHLRVAADAFGLGAMLSAPHLAFSLIFYLGGGLMARLMPNFQVFFVLQSPQILIGLALLVASLPLLMDVFMNHFAAELMYWGQP